MEALSSTAVREIERISQEAAGKTVVIDGVTYSTTSLHDVRKREPEPDTIVVHTLRSLVEYTLAQDSEYWEGRGRFVHVKDPTTVRLLTEIHGDHNQRVCLARAEAVVPKLPDRQWRVPEGFVIYVLGRFAPTEERERLLRLVGNLTDGVAQSHVDDGVTQSVTVRSGVSLVKNAEVVNPFHLTPYRSFAEIEQVTSPYFLRLSSGGEKEPPQCSLFEADGGQWRLDAIGRVKAWLQEEFGDEPDPAVYG